MASDKSTVKTTPEKSRPGSSLLYKSAQGASSLIALQVSSRALTFVVNQLLLRYLSPDLLGVSTQLEVYSISVLFFAREALRVTIQRQTDTDVDTLREASERRISAEQESAAKTQAIVNLSYISVAIGVILAPTLGWLYYRSVRSEPAILAIPYFQEALQLYGLAAFLELLSEPYFVVVQQKSHYTKRAVAESTAALSRCVVTCGTVVFAARKGLSIGVLPFALGQCTYGLLVLVCYYVQIWSASKTFGFSYMLAPIISSNEYILSYFHRPLLALGSSLFFQGIIKHVLTQGDVILISYLATLEDQGIYALASNYGGLVARMLFQPIEESSRGYFGKKLSSISNQPKQDDVETASRHLHLLLRSYLLLSIAIASIGPTVAPLLLGIVAGPRWTSSGAGEVLAQYCYYIPFLAVNGITEAFVSAVALEAEVNGQSIWMFSFSIGFASAGYVLLKIFNMGAKGLVWANVFNMTLRILWSVAFINGYLRRSGNKLDLLSLLPTPITIAGGVVTATVLNQIHDTFNGGVTDLVKSCLVAGGFIIIL